jgi:hypothetical protein
MLIAITMLLFLLRSMSDSSVAGFLRKAFSERSQKLLSGSLKAPDGAALQAVLGKLNEEEKAREYTFYENQLCADVSFVGFKCSCSRALHGNGLAQRCRRC